MSSHEPNTSIYDRDFLKNQEDPMAYYNYLRYIIYSYHNMDLERFGIVDDEQQQSVHEEVFDCDSDKAKLNSPMLFGYHNKWAFAGELSSLYTDMLEALSNKNDVSKKEILGLLKDYKEGISEFREKIEDDRELARFDLAFGRHDMFFEALKKYHPELLSDVEFVADAYYSISEGALVHADSKIIMDSELMDAFFGCEGKEEKSEGISIIKLDDNGNKIYERYPDGSESWTNNDKGTSVRYWRDENQGISFVEIEGRGENGEIVWTSRLDKEGNLLNQLIETEDLQVEAMYANGELATITNSHYLDGMCLVEREEGYTFDVNGELSAIETSNYIHEFDMAGEVVDYVGKQEKYYVQDGYITTGNLQYKESYYGYNNPEERQEDDYEPETYDEYEFDNYDVEEIIDAISPSEFEIDEVTSEIIEGQEKEKNKDVK